MFSFMKRRRRDRLKARPFPPEWLRIIEKNVALYRRLPEADRRELQGDVQVFLSEKRFEGCGGLRMTDEIQVTIAAQACLLLLHRETDYFPGLYSILVYPTAYIAKEVEHSDAGLVTEREEDRLGEAWETGTVVLSWDDVLAGATGELAGENVVLHEFAHVLDQENGEPDGVPVLPRGMHASWSRVMRGAYEQLRRDVEAGRPTFLGEDAAEDPSEFLAFATESFFTTPAQLKQEHPDVYDQFKAFYRQDPLQYAGA